jgi:glycosyltransferase involved in cell wall biosynthesis
MVAAVKMIGLGIVTYNRIDRLKKVVAAIQALTVAPYRLIVADDGSSDGTAEWCRNNGIRVVSGMNRGVCWNKNRALYALHQQGCDPILLIEDDIFPIELGWEEHWRIATQRWGHVSYAHPKLLPWLIAGSGTALDPYQNAKASAQCASIGAGHIAQLGYFDTRYKGYGVGHVEWTGRAHRLGIGFVQAVNRDGVNVRANLYIHGGLQHDDAPSYRNKASVLRNLELLQVTKREAIYRNPWCDEEERLLFLEEQQASAL